MKDRTPTSNDSHSCNMPKAHVIRPSCPNCPPRPALGICLTLYLALFDTSTQRNEETGVKETHCHWGYLMVHWDELNVMSYQLKQPFAPWKWWKYDKPRAYKGDWPERTFPVVHITYGEDVEKKHLTCEKTMKSTILGDTADQEHFKQCPCYTWVDRVAQALERKGYIDPNILDMMEQWCDHLSHGETARHRGGSAVTTRSATCGTAVDNPYALQPVSSLVQLPPFSSFPASPVSHGVPWNGQAVPAPTTTRYPYAAPARYAYPSDARYPYPTVGGSYYPGSDPAYYRTYACPVKKEVTIKEPGQEVRIKEEDMLH
ncbi:hypothetical protein CALVIDRAFT_24387 [Calocera viscosa TUFC12733]|uniref:Uncharacterized protein n=1 Tax=Calocera viscosa (strain TUFC12733) TaxID=1330018 RepID=A0A167P7M2_CALVF|nr:hypothetical protein CALVIDRAFT_24387 [Calocera viscosa TUFC12733]